MNYKRSKADRKEYAEQMIQIGQYCERNNIQISSTGDSYYFNYRLTSYRVSNHTVAKSDAGMINIYGEKVRDSYHTNNNVICITASKTRIIEIHKDILAGIQLDKRGKRS